MGLGEKDWTEREKMHIIRENIRETEGVYRGEEIAL